MKKLKQHEQVRLNLTMERDFYEIIKKQAQDSYLKVTAFVVQHLKKTLLPQPIASGQPEADSVNTDDNLISNSLNYGK
ncbi:hypothetical protein ACFLU5_16925 [Bacteroidota bacterium]